MEEDLLVFQTITLAISCGVLSYIFSRILKIPAILFYLGAGMLMGPMGLNLIQVEAALGKGLVPLVEIAVALILFEGGLALSHHSFREASTGIRRILFVTLPLTCCGATLLSMYFLNLPWRFALFFGALIVVTGPTVIGSILKSVSLVPRLEILLNWESLWGDVLGVLISALALEFILLPAHTSLYHPALVFGVRIVIGICLGLIGGFLISVVLKQITKLQEPGLAGLVVFAGALFLFFAANRFIEASGPLAVAVGGFFLSSRRDQNLCEVRHFKEQIASLFISTLFVLLSASIDPRPLIHLWPAMGIIALILGAIIRPAAVLLALSGTSVPYRERFFIGIIGPRGIIAVATAAYAALVVDGSEQYLSIILTLTFAIILISGASATLFSKPLSNLLKVRIPLSESGLLIVGINPVSSEIAKFASQYVPVAFLDTDPNSCRMASAMGHQIICADLLDGEVYEQATRDGFERLIAITRNDALNDLITARAAVHFTPARVYRVTAGNSLQDEILLPPSLHTQTAFSDDFKLTEAIRKTENGIMRLQVKPPENRTNQDIPLVAATPSKKGVHIVIDPKADMEDSALYLSPVKST